MVILILMALYSFQSAFEYNIYNISFHLLSHFVELTETMLFSFFLNKNNKHLWNLENTGREKNYL